MKHNHSHQVNLAGIMDLHEIGEARQIRKAVILGCLINFLLMAMKVVVGQWGHSEALTADGFHSLGDVATDLIMLIFVGISFRKPGKSFNYGYGKFETFATLMISILLLSVSVVIGVESSETIKAYMNGEAIERPDIYTLVAVAAAICCKEFLFRYYRKVGRRTRCNALISSAWHHRSDALASLVTVVGLCFAIFMGEKWRIFDPCASILIGLLILIIAIRMFMGALGELMEKSLPEEEIEQARKDVGEVAGVKSVEYFKSRKSGPFLIFDVAVGVDGNISVREGNVIGDGVEETLRKLFGKNIIVSVVTSSDGE